MNFLNNKRIKGAFYTWKFKAEKHKFESKLKDQYKLKRCFRKWLKLKNKRRIISDLVNKKKNALSEKFIEKSKSIDNILIYKSKQYFIGRLIKNINNQLVCDMIDNSYINNYKRMLMHKLSILPKFVKGFTKLDKTLNDKIKKDAIKKIKKKFKVNSFGEKLKNTLIKKIKEKFLSKIDFNKDYDDTNLDKEEIKIIKSGKKLKRIISKNAFNKLKNYFQKHKNIDALTKSTEKIFKKKFSENFRDRIDKINAINNIQKIMDKKKKEDFISKLKDISDSSQGKNNQKKIRCIKLKNTLQKIILNKVLKDAFNEIKNNYNIIIGTNNLNKLMSKRYKNRFLYLIQLIYMHNKPKKSKINSRYPLFNMTDLSTKIEKFLLEKTKKKFINQLQNIKAIDKQLNYMFLTLNNKVKKEIFDFFKTLHFVNKLNQIIHNIKDKRNELNKKEFFNKLKNERDNNKINEDNNNNLLRNTLSNWNLLTNKNKILNLLKNHLKTKKYFDLWKTKVDLNEIKNKLIDKKKLRDKNNKELLGKYFNEWKEYAEKKNVLSKVKKLKKVEINKKICSKLKNILKSLDKKNVSKYFNEWKNNSKLLEIKNIPDKPQNLKLLPQTIYNAEYKPKKPKRQEFLIMKQNVIYINDNNTKAKDKTVKNDKSIKKRKVKRNKSKSKPKPNKYDKNFEFLKKSFEKWKKNAQEMKLKDDFKHIINKMKDYNDKNGIKDNNMPNSNEEILQKLKKATVYLLLDIYKKNRDLLLKKYFNKWKKNMKEKNKVEKEEEPENKYIKKKLGFDYRLKEINNDKYNPKKLNSRNEKIFLKKKTKFNLYKEKINLYNSLSSRTIYDKPQPEYHILNSESTYNDKRENYIPYYSTENILNEIPEKEYIRKSIKKRNHIPKIMSMTVFNEREDDREDDNEDITAEYPPIEIIENKIPSERKNETEDKANIINLINLDKTLSSIDYSTNNHITLIEESNEVRKPDKYTKKPIYEKKNQINGNKKIKNLLSPYFENINISNNQYKNNNKFTDGKSRNQKKDKYFDSNAPDLYSNTSKSQQNRNRKKDNPKMFIVSIPVNNEDDELGKGDRIEELKYSEFKTDKITPMKRFDNVYLNEEKNKKGNMNMKTPFRDYSINWGKGNSTCPRIINTDMDKTKNDYLNDYSLIGNKGYKGNNNKLNRHNKSKSGLDYINENKGYYYNNDTDNNYTNTKYDSSRKKLFI